MTLDQLRYALELQKTRNFSKAAENCHITQPSLSVQIAKLEDELGVVLFARERSGVEVTEHGDEILKQARLILEEANRISEIASDLKGEVQGNFRLGIIPTLASTLLPLFLRDFSRRYPKVRLSVTEEPTERLVAAIDEGDLDGAILSTPAQCPESLLEKVLFYEPFQIFASAGHPILKNKKVAPNQISAAEILLLDDAHCLRDQVLQLCRSQQKLSDHALRIQSASLQTLIELIRHDEGYTLLPGLSASLLSDRERREHLRSFEKPLPSRKVSLVFHRAHLKRSIIEALKQVIADSLPDDVFPTSAKQSVRVVSPGSEHFEI